MALIRFATVRVQWIAGVTADIHGHNRTRLSGIIANHVSQRNKMPQYGTFSVMYARVGPVFVDGLSHANEPER